MIIPVSFITFETNFEVRKPQEVKKKKLRDVIH